MTFDFDDVQTLMGDDLPINTTLSAGSASLALVAIYQMSVKWRWKGISTDDWDTIQAQVAQLEKELMTESQLGHIVPIVTGPKSNELVCDGSQYDRVDYPELYAVLESEYIDDADSFHVPNIHNNFLVGAGDSYSPDETGGENSHTLSESEMPSHRHSYSDYTANPDLEGLGVPDPLAIGLPKIQSANTNYTGGGNSHENRPPFIGLTFVVIAK
jgi:microcystin-dependent protein